MFVERTELQQLKIYYLFMHADGSPSMTEANYLSDILTKSNLPEEAKKDFYAFYGQKSLMLSTATFETVIAEMDALLGEKTSSCFLFPLSTLDHNKNLQAQTIWTLINLGYADGDYSDAEKQFISHLVERWKMDPTLVAEFTDTASTILALTMQKEWIQNTSKPYLTIHSIVQELDRSISSMAANIEISISEADIA